MLTEMPKLLICDFLKGNILTKEKSRTLFRIWDVIFFHHFAFGRFHPSQQ
jgi:hypothetical protein